MAQATDNKTGKRTYRDYNKYLIPFFGQYEVGKITVEMLADFESWRISEMGKIPMASTKHNHASAHIRVINLARDSSNLDDDELTELLCEAIEDAQQLIRQPFQIWDLDADDY